MKQFKQVISIMLVCAITLIASANLSVSASATVLETAPEFQFTASPYALASVRGTQVSGELQQVLAMNDIKVAENTLIEALPSNAADGATVLQITNISGSAISKDMLVPIAADGNVSSIIALVDAQNAATRSTNIEAWDPFADGSMCIHISVSYNTPISGNNYKVQPVNARFKCMDPDALHTVTKGKVEYLCKGFEYTYPGGVCITTGSTPYTHKITISKSNPVDARWYTSTSSNAYSTDRVINLDNGLYDHRYTWSFTIDGRVLTGEIEIFPNG